MNPRTDIRTVEEYIDLQPAAARPLLQTVRGAIRAALPDASETIAYGMPSYRVAGVAAVYFGGWKNHYSLYPVDEDVLAALGDRLAHSTLSGKGTIRFRSDEPVPVGLISDIARMLGAKAEARSGSSRSGRRQAAAVRRSPPAHR